MGGCRCLRATRGPGPLYTHRHTVVPLFSLIKRHPHYTCQFFSTRICFIQLRINSNSNNSHIHRLFSSAYRNLRFLATLHFYPSCLVLHPLQCTARLCSPLRFMMQAMPSYGAPPSNSKMLFPCLHCITAAGLRFAFSCE